jgi:hypothetical protein
MTVWLGDVYAASYTAPGVATVVLTVTAPDGTTSVPTVITSAAPIYTSTVPTPLIGAYLLTWVASGAQVDVFVDQFVAVAPSLALISFTDLKDQLNISTSDTSGNAKLRRFMQSASDVVQNITGPMLGQSRTEYFSGNRQTIVLSPRWVQSITLIVETLGTSTFTLTEQPLAAGTFTQYGYTWDRDTHKIIRRANGVTAFFPDGDENVAVTYKQGISPLPQVITDATGDIIEHWWTHGQQPRSVDWNNPVGNDDDLDTATVLGYAVPYAAMTKLAPYALGPTSA